MGVLMMGWNLHGEVRPPAVAGSFYPADAAELRAEVRRFLAAGPTSAQALALIRGCRGLDLAGADVVEVVPELDSSHLTGTVAATVAYELLSLMACSRQACG